MINLYLINNDFLPFIIEFLRKKVVVLVPIFINNINSLEYFIEDNTYRITISGIHYYYFVSEMDMNKLIKKIRTDIIYIKKKENYKTVDIVLDQFINDDTFDVRINSIKSSMQLINNYELNSPFTLYQVDNDELNKILNYYTYI